MQHYQSPKMLAIASFVSGIFPGFLVVILNYFAYYISMAMSRFPSNYNGFFYFLTFFVPISLLVLGVLAIVFGVMSITVFLKSEPFAGKRMTGFFTVTGVLCGFVQMVFAAFLLFLV